MRVALLLIAATAAGCAAGTTGTDQGARLQGAQDLVKVGDLVLITSTNGNELRALNLTTGRFVRAPNPLEPLSIPVLERPVGLVGDLRYEGEDLAEPGGPYVYALAAGASQLSIVAVRSSKPSEDPAQPVEQEWLVELLRLPTGGPVTAVAGLGSLTASATTGPSQLFFATFEAGAGSVWTVELPPPDELKDTSVQSILGKARLLVTASGEAVSALLPLPNGRLVVATRADAGRAGRTVVLDITTLTTTPLPFPGPVRHLATHGLANGRQAGSYVFGVLDEQTCSLTGCGGVLAVNLATASIAEDATGRPMAPIRFGRAIPQGLGLGTQVNTRVPTADGQFAAVELPVLGAVSASTGELFLFDAFALLHLVHVFGRIEDPQGGASSYEVVPNGSGPTSIVALGSAARDGAISLTFEGVIPGLAELPTSDADGARFPVPAELVGRAGLGDSLVVGPGCELPVVSVEPAALLAATPLPAACAGRTAFTVRAGGTQPYVAQGSENGYLGRVGHGQELVFQPNPADPSEGHLRLTFGAGDPARARDLRYVLESADRFLPLAISVDLSAVGRARYYLPRGVVVAPELRRIYVAFPSADSVAGFDPATAARGATENIEAFR